MGDRSRSRSPRRQDSDRSRPKKTGGFRWKEKRRDDDPREDRKLERGYRERDERPRSPHRDSDRDRRRDDRDAPREDRAEKKDKEKKKKKKPVIPQSSEPMIVVYVNDRLGTKAEIPCLASDPIKLFKAQVAARIGREPHEILLKRQGERPFKDQLTLEDYGVSNGVQLDLEVGTGD
ncbi:hypothetical protein N7488_000544 [Penicillium malachiteum]|nr:hypothetical protein N7488_000544 [Penicillium malachiteum]